MSVDSKPLVAIVDYGRGNLFSVAQACQYVGLRSVTTACRDEIQDADAVILPGVGAFGDAMAKLVELDLVEPLRDVAASGTPFLGVCLGMQLLMTEGREFGTHRGMGLIEGEVVPLSVSQVGDVTLKVPHVGWNKIIVPTVDVERQNQSNERTQGNKSIWKSPFLEYVPNGEYMYFVHSYYPKPANSDVVVSISNYGPLEFSSSITQGNVFGCQFHPERSGPSGLKIYRNLVKLITNSNETS